jgi:hypothetical protein
MRQLLILTILTSSLLSCNTKTETTTGSGGIQLLIPDTSNNSRARVDLDDIKYRSKLENQIGLNDLQKGADSLEIRLWYNASFSNSIELYILNLRDTNCLISYYRVYPRQINFDDEKRNRKWDPYSDPIIDSSVSKSVLLTKDNYKNLHFDSIWLLKSQSELKIPDSVGSTDCNGYVLEIADRKRFKYMRHHCPMGYYEDTKLAEILTYMDFCSRIMYLAREHNSTVPYEYD